MSVKMEAGLGREFWRAGALAVMVSVAAVSASLVIDIPVAQAAETKNVLSPRVGKPMQEAQKLAQAKKFPQALAKVKEAQALSGKTPYETSVVNDYLAYVAVNMKDYPLAAKTYEEQIAAGNVPQAQVAQRSQQVVVLYYQASQYPQAVAAGQRFLKSHGNNAEVMEIVMHSYYQQKDYVHAAESAQQLIRLTEQGGKAPKQDWFKLMQSAQHEAGQTEQVAVTQEQIVARFASAAEWQQMFRFMPIAKLNDRERLELFRLKRANDALSSQESVEMAELALALGLPGDAKRVLATVSGADARTSRLAGLAATQAQADQAKLPQFEQEAQAAKTGETDAALGEAYLSYGAFDKATVALNRALKKGGLKSPELTQLHLGMALIGAKKGADAQAAFKAIPASSSYARQARLWAILAAQNPRF